MDAAQAYQFASIRDLVIAAAEQGAEALATPYEVIMSRALECAADALPDGPERLVVSLAIAAYRDAEDRRLMRIVRDGAPASSRAAAALLVARQAPPAPRIGIAHGVAQPGRPAESTGGTA